MGRTGAAQGRRSRHRQSGAGSSKGAGCGQAAAAGRLHARAAVLSLARQSPGAINPYQDMKRSTAFTDVREQLAY